MSNLERFSFTDDDIRMINDDKTQAQDAARREAAAKQARDRRTKN